jgi:hypothetical protein
MVVCWCAGRWGSAHLSLDGEQKDPSRFYEASVTIIGLLLAFSFSMAAAKYDNRRAMVIQDSNGIGDFYTVVSLLQDPVKSELQKLLRTYTEHRLSIVKQRHSGAEFEKALDEIPPMFAEMQRLIGVAIEAPTPVAFPLVNTFNAVTSNHAARLAAARDRLPDSIKFLLILSLCIGMFLAGLQQGTFSVYQLITMLGFVLLTSLVIWVILDLNEPVNGVITVSQEPLERLLAGMGGG